MGPFLTRFSIRDLEEFSGVKAHTIRIWERRYGLFAPDRTETNIRTYGLDELKAILNVAFLNRNGVKISKIANLKPIEREQQVRRIAEERPGPDQALDDLKLAMVSFDLDLFERTSTLFRDREGFRALVERLYVPLLEHIGVLWQTNTICPAQEHFISNLVRQKIVVAIDTVRPSLPGSGVTHVLFLPENEIHELGLLYVHYLLRSAGERVIYLGQGVPKNDLQEVASQLDGAVHFIGILTAYPPTEELTGYFNELREQLPESRITFSFCGSRLHAGSDIATPSGFTLFRSLKEFVATLA